MVRREEFRHDVVRKERCRRLFQRTRNRAPNRSKSYAHKGFQRLKWTASVMGATILSDCFVSPRPVFGTDKMNCWVYVLRGADGRNYVGITQRLRRRIWEHNAGRSPADAGRGPFVLVYKEEHPNHSVAREREKFLKSGVGRAWLKEKLK